MAERLMTKRQYTQEELERIIQRFVLFEPADTAVCNLQVIFPGEAISIIPYANDDYSRCRVVIGGAEVECGKV